MKRFLIIFFVLMPFLGCQGTETGNPGTPGAQPTDDGESACLAIRAKEQAADNIDVVVDDVIQDLCSRIIACGVATTTDACVNALNGEDGDLMTDEFGLLPAGSYTVLDWRSGLNDGSITFSTTALADCESEIDALACSVVTTYMPTAVFSTVENFTPDACSGAFSDATPEAQPIADGCP